jgi:hypothetical protein
MFKKKLILNIALSAVAIAVVILCVFSLKDSFRPTYDGVIYVEYVDVEGNVKKQKAIAFVEGYSLTNLIEENFENVTFDNGMLMTIEDFITPPTWQYFIYVLVDGEASQVGIEDIEFTDGTKITLMVTMYSLDNA